MTEKDELICRLKFQIAQMTKLLEDATSKLKLASVGLGRSNSTIYGEPTFATTATTTDDSDLYRSNILNKKYYEYKINEINKPIDDYYNLGRGI